MINFFSFNAKVVLIKEKSIIASFDYKNASFIYIIKTCNYINETCVYSLLLTKRKFGNGQKEVYL